MNSPFPNPEISPESNLESNHEISSSSSLESNPESNLESSPEISSPHIPGSNPETSPGPEISSSSSPGSNPESSSSSNPESSSNQEPSTSFQTLEIPPTLYQELVTYQFPQVNPSDLLLEPYRSYIQMYIQQSQGYEFFQGVIQPSVLKRAKIYRGLSLSSELNSSELNSSDNSEPKDHPDYILFVSSNAIVIKKKPEQHFPRYHFFLSQSNQYVFVPPNADCLDLYQFVYTRRLLSNFNLTEKINGKIIFNHEQDRYFLMLSLDHPMRDELTRKWTQYIQGGVIRSFEFRSERLEQVLSYFKWNERDHYKIVSDDLIRIWVRSPSIDDFQQKVGSIQSGLLSPGPSE